MVTFISKVAVTITFRQTTILENPLVISIYPGRALFSGGVSERQALLISAWNPNTLFFQK